MSAKVIYSNTPKWPTEANSSIRALMQRFIGFESKAELDASINKMKDVLETKYATKFFIHRQQV